MSTASVPQAPAPSVGEYMSGTCGQAKDMGKLELLEEGRDDQMNRAVIPNHLQFMKSPHNILRGHNLHHYFHLVERDEHNFPLYL